MTANRYDDPNCLSAAPVYSEPLEALIRLGAPYAFWVTGLQQAYVEGWQHRANVAAAAVLLQEEAR